MQPPFRNISPSSWTATDGGRSAGDFRASRDTNAGVDTVRRVTEVCRQARHFGADPLCLLRRELGKAQGGGRLPDGHAGRLPEGRDLHHEDEQHPLSRPSAGPSGFRSSARTWIDRAVAETAMNTGMVLNLALSYGGRGEILEAIKRLRAANGSEPVITEERPLRLSRHRRSAGPGPDHQDQRREAHQQFSSLAGRLRRALFHRYPLAGFPGAGPAGRACWTTRAGSGGSV